MSVEVERAASPLKESPRHVKTDTIAVCFLVGLVAAALGCGNGGKNTGPAASSGLPRSETVLLLEADQLRKLCDWSANRQGGYGNHVPCDGGSGGPYDSRTACVEDIDFFSRYCPDLTVGDYEDCINALADDLCGFPTTDACAALRACLSSP